MSTGVRCRVSGVRKWVLGAGRWGLGILLVTCHLSLVTAAFGGTHVTGTYDLGANPRVMATVNGTPQYGLVFAQRNKLVIYGDVEYGPSVVKGYLNSSGQLNDGAGNLWLDLIPNLGATPGDSYYVLTLNIQGRVHAEIWVVPDVASVSAEVCRQAQPPSSTAPALFYQFLQQDGDDLPQRQKLNFSGAGVNCVDNAGQLRTDCAVSGGGSVSKASATTSGTVKTDTTESDPVVYLKSSADSLLAAKAPLAHSHAESDVTNLVTDLSGKVANTRAVNTTAPLSGGGALSSDLTLSLPAASGSQNGYLASADWTTFNSKESALSFNAPLNRSVNTISIPQASGSQSGYLASGDWTTFNNKVSTSRSISTTAPLQGGGNLSADRTLFLDLFGTSPGTKVVSTSLAGDPATDNCVKWLAGGKLGDAGAACGSGGGSHNLLSATHSDTTAASAVRGDGIFAIGSTPTWQRLGHPTTSGGYFKWNGTDIVASTNAAAGTGACTNQVVTAENADGAPTCTTITSAYTSGTFSPTAHNLLSTAHGDTSAASVVLGDLIAGNSTPAWQRLAGNTTTTKKFLTQTGTGSVSALPAWGTIADGDIPSTIVRTSRQISTTSPLSGGGTLASDLTLTCPTCEVTGNKNAANGYAGLTASTKLNVAQGQEVWGLADLSDVSGTSGSGSTAILSTLTGLAANDLLKWSGSNWANTSSIPESQVTNLTTDLAGKVPTSRNVNTSSPLGGGGALSSDLTLTCNTCEVTGNKNAASGYAGLTSGTKLAASQGQEVWSVSDLTDYSTTSGSGSTALKATITSPSSNDVLTWNGSNWINQAPSGGSSHNLLSSTHTDTDEGSAVLGDIISANSTPHWQRVAGNTTGTKKFLTQTGTGSVSALPAWGTIADADIPDTIARTASPTLTGTVTVDGIVNQAATDSGTADLTGIATWTVSTHTAGSQGQVVGIAGSAAHDGTGGSVGILTGVGGFVGLYTGGTVSKMASLEAWSNEKASGTVTDNYGLYIQNQTAGTNNYAIYTEGTMPSKLGGAVDAVGGFKVNGVATNHSVLLGNGTIYQGSGAIPDCQDAGGNHLNYTQSTKAFSCGTTGGGGGGDSISVNGSAAADADFDDSTPAAPASAINVKWQKDASTPNNLSAYVPYASPLTVTSGNLTVGNDSLGPTQIDETASYSFSGTLGVPVKADPGSPTVGEIWVNQWALRYRDNSGTPVTRTVEVMSNKNAASGYAGLTASTKLTASQGQEVWAFTDLSDVAISSPSTGQVPRYNGSGWANSALACTDVTNCPALVTAGSAGTGPSNQGTATTAARSDHDHRSLHQLAWFFPGTPATGVQNLTLTLPEGLSNIAILDLRVTVNTTSTSSSTFNLQRCTANCTGASPTFGDIYSTALTLGASTRTASKGTAPDQNLSSLASGDQFKASLVTIGASLADVTVTMTYKYDTKN